MRRTLPPLSWLRSFEAAARTLSFTAAAEEIGLTQSAVSQQIKSLEQRLGTPLFLRKPRGLALTDEGRKLLPQVARALSMLAQATEPFGAAHSQDIITVATSVSVAQWLIAPGLSSFRAAHPQVRLRLLSTVWPDDFHALQADVQVRFGTRNQAAKTAQALEPARLIPIKAPDLAGRIADLPLIETVGTSAGWSAWQAAYGSAGQPVFFADTYGLAMQLAVEGNGVALVSEVLAGPALRSGQLERALDGSIAAEEGYFLSFNEEVPGATAFAHWLQARCASGGQLPPDQTVGTAP